MIVFSSSRSLGFSDLENTEDGNQQVRFALYNACPC